MRKLFLLMVLCAVWWIPAQAQTNTCAGLIAPNGVCVPTYTVATRPTAVKGELIYVTDGNSATDCTVGGGANNVLCLYNGSAWVSSSSGGGGLTGPGFTTGSIPFATGALTLGQDNASLFWDGTNHTGGVGTTRTGAISGTNPSFRIKGTGATSATSSFEVQDSNAATKFFVRNDGNVGIGTATPATQLHINGAGNQILTLQATDASQARIDFLRSGAHNYMVGNTLTVAGFQVYDNSSSVSRFTSLDTGFVGINNAAPASPFSVGAATLAGGDVQIASGGLAVAYGGLATTGNGLASVQAAPAAITIGSGANIAATSLCSTTLCPAGDYDVAAYVEITTACTTTGSYIVWLGWTDDGTAKTGSSTTTFFPFPLNGNGVPTTVGTIVPAAAGNYATAHIFLHTTGVATGGAGSINYGATATACGSGGPMVGKLFLDVTRLR